MRTGRLDFFKTFSRQRLYLILLGLLLAARLLVAIPIYHDPTKGFWIDSNDYNNLAMKFLKGTAYTGQATDSGELFRTPLYPAFMALVYKVSGVQFGNIAVAQLILGGISCLLLYFMLIRKIPHLAAFLLCCFYALDPSSTFWATNIMSETLFTFFVVLVIYCLMRWWQKGSWVWAILAGALAAGSILVRPIGQVLLPVWGALVLLRILRPEIKNRKIHFFPEARPLKTGLLFIGVIGLILLPYMFYNYRVWGQFTISSVDTYNFGRYHAAPVLAQARGISLDEAIKSLNVSLAPAPGDRARFLAVIRQYPSIYARLFIQGDLIVLFWPEYHRWFGLFNIQFITQGSLEKIQSGKVLEALRSLWSYATSSPLTGVALLACVGYQLGLYGLVISGLIRALQKGVLRGPTLWWVTLIGITAMVLLLTPGPVGEQRFRIPAQPLLFYLAGLNWWSPDDKADFAIQPHERKGQSLDG
jgi:Dolichyl-phosphate-mannose-protein mannosyltransferase